MSQLDALRTAILSLDGPVFAVLDGAQFENLPQTLMFAGIEARCLYLDRGDNHPERLVTAPYMVGPLEEEVLDQVLSLLPQMSAAVFWECPDGADALYRHLRGINMVEIPRGIDEDAEISPTDVQDKLPDAAETTVPSSTGSEPGDFEMVLLRHADGNVMDQITRSLASSEIGRLFGPGSAIVFQTSEAWRISQPRVVRSAESGPKGRGPLRLHPAALDKIGDLQLEASRLRLKSYLEDMAPEEFGKLSEGDKRRLLIAAEESGYRHGFESEQAHGLWAFLLVVTGGALFTGEAMSNHLATTDLHPDDAIEELMEELAEMDEAEMEAYLA